MTQAPLTFELLPAGREYVQVRLGADMSLVLVGQGKVPGLFSGLLQWALWLGGHKDRQNRRRSQPDPMIGWLGRRHAHASRAVHSLTGLARTPAL